MRGIIHDMKRTTIIGIVIAIVALLALVVAMNREWLVSRYFSPTESSIQSRDTDGDAVSVVANNLETPWTIAFLPDGTRVVTERGGAIRVGDQQPAITVEGVVERGEGGLLGLAIHPDYTDNNRVYIYYTTERQGQLVNQVDRATLRDNELLDRQPVLETTPGATTHNGGAIEFGPDGKLYIANGDAAQPDLAQDLESLAGKILRVNDDGSIPDDNPFDGSRVYSYGHRNPQGLAWDSDGRLWSVEHGPRANDELNLIEAGGNYGWPTITGTQTRREMRSPVATSGDSETWAPSRLVYVDGTLYFTGLRGQSLYRASIDGDSVSLERLLANEYGRLRALAVHDERLYVGTSNRDGRGQPDRQDDRILRIDVNDLRVGE